MNPSPPSTTGLSPTEKRMLLAELLRKKATEDAVFPLSYGQRGLWFLAQLDRESAAYHVFFPARIRSHMDIPAFRRALQALIARHPSLRTTFEQYDGEPWQRVHSSLADGAAVKLEVHDAAAWSKEVLHARVEEEAYRPFDLERGPLARMHLFSLAIDEHIFLLTAHHLIGDFWSLVLLMEEMQALYSGERSRSTRGANHPQLADASPGPMAHYRDFVRWQREMLAGSEGARLRSYWEKQLAGVPPLLELPTDRPRPPHFRQRGAAAPCHIGPELTGRLKALAAAEGVTLYTVLLTAFEVLLARYSGQEDFVIGSPFAGRSRSEFERVVGCFMNMLPLRANLAGKPTFRELLRRTSTTVLEALQHQDYPFPLLVERLNLPRDPSRTPLVQVSFTLEKAHRPVGLGCWSFFLPQTEVHLNVGGLHAEPYPLQQRTCQMDLEMVLEEGADALYGMLRYNTDLFEEATIVRLIDHYRLLLISALNDPQKCVYELPLLTTTEERCVLYEWNDTHVDFPRDLCLHHLFEQQAARSPQAIALRFGERTVCYGELDAWANQLACRLQQQGVGPDVLVALCLERSPEMIAAILGVLKAGGAYVPLDPASPKERLRSILADIRAPVLLTQHRLKKRLPDWETHIVCVDDESALVRSQRQHGIPLPALRTDRPDHLAYVIYTSGSTGRPKGVMMEHRAICNTICWQQQALPIGPDDRVLLLIPYVFDASLAIIFPTLAAGAELVLAAPGEERDPGRILELLRRERITVLPLLPSLLRLMLDERLREAGRTLRWVCCGGEVLPPDVPARLFELVDADLYNLYGPTETAINATWWLCRRGEDRSRIPIGRPIANVQVYVLDAQQRPAPIGVPGELYIGGAGLARGYWNDPCLTAERFVPNPFVSPRPFPSQEGKGKETPFLPCGRGAEGREGARLYRTGDRCRWLAEGSLEFLGRVDQQVKLHGYRIETGEIESLLAMHPAVLESAVILHEKERENPRLAAYVTARSGTEAPTAEELRRYLQERLPDYMVPSAFVLLPAMPRTPSGKVDRGALPAPLVGRPDHQPFVAPRTPLEEYLAGLWRELLGVQKVGICDNFFALGGNSIQAAVFINRVQEKLGRQVYTVALFETPTIAGLARYLTDLCPDEVRALFGEGSLSADLQTSPVKERGTSPPSYGRDWNCLLVPLQANGTRPACFLVHPPGGIVVCYQALAQRLDDERPLYGIRSRGLYGETELPASLEEMAAEYVTAIRAVQPQGPYHLGGWSMGGIIAYEMAQQLRHQGQTIGLLALLDTTIPYNAANALYAEDAAQSAREYGLDFTLEELGRLGPDEQLPYLWDHVRKLGLVDEDTPLPLVQQILNDLKRLFHAHIQLGGNYVLRPYPGRLTLFRPQEAPVPVQTAPDRNWGKLAAAVDVHFVPGQHHTMVKEPHVQVLAHKLRQCLRQAEGERGV